MTPSIEVAKKLAEAFGVTLNSLVSQHEQSASVQDSSMLERVRAIGELSPDGRDSEARNTEITQAVLQCVSVSTEAASTRQRRQ